MRLGPGRASGSAGCPEPSALLPPALPWKQPPRPSPWGCRWGRGRGDRGMAKPSCNWWQNRSGSPSSACPAAEGTAGLHLPGGEGWGRQRPGGPGAASAPGGSGGGGPGLGRGLGPTPQVLIFPWHPRLSPDGSAPGRVPDARPGPRPEQSCPRAVPRRMGTARVSQGIIITHHILYISPSFFFFSKLPQSGSNMLHAC